MSANENNSPESGVTSEIDRLLAAIERNEATADELARLDFLVCNEPRARMRYLNSTHLKAAMEWERVGNKLTKAVLKPELAGRVEETPVATNQENETFSSTATPALLPNLSQTESPLQQTHTPDAPPPISGNGIGWFNQRLSLFVIAILATCLGVLFLGYLQPKTNFTQADKPDSSIEDRNAENKGLGNEVSGNFLATNVGKNSVARLTNSWDAIWRDSKSAPRNGELLGVDQQLDLVGGLAEVTFECGAVVIVQSPASLVIKAPNGVSLDSGRITAQVPGPTAKFWVITPTMKVLDLGTEFGISADSSGRSQVRVFEGVVEVEPRSGGKTTDDKIARRTLLAGQVGLVEPRGVYHENPDGSELANAFVRTMPNNYENDYVRNILNSRPWGYWNFNSVISSTLIPDATGHGRFGQLQGNAMVVQGGSIMAIGQTAAFDGDGDSVLVPTGATVSFNGDFSIEALFRTVNEGVLLAKVPSDRTWNPGSKILFLRGGSVKFTPFPSGKKTDTLQANLYLNDNQWHHVVLTNKANVSGSLDRTILFVDGVVRTYRSDWDITSNDDANFPILIGHGCDSYPVSPDKRGTKFPSHKYFQGDIDETAVYTRCLTCDEVQSHYRAYLVAGIHRRNSSAEIDPLHSPNRNQNSDNTESEED